MRKQTPEEQQRTWREVEQALFDLYGVRYLLGPHGIDKIEEEEER